MPTPNPDYPHHKPKPKPKHHQNSRLRTHATADGWSTVTRTPTAHLSARALSQIQAAHAPRDLSQGDDVDRWLCADVSVDVLKGLFGELRAGRAWRDWVAGLRRCLGKALGGDEGVNGDGMRVESAVCFATGSLSAERVGWDARARRRAMWQVLLFVEIIDICSSLLPRLSLLFLFHGLRGGVDLQCYANQRPSTNTVRTHNIPLTRMYAQEPDYTSVDIAFLHSLGITACRDNTAFGQAGPASFVYAPFMEAELLVRRVLVPANPVLSVHVDFLEAFGRLCEVRIGEEGSKGEWEGLNVDMERYGRMRERERLVRFEEDGLEGLCKPQSEMGMSLVVNANGGGSLRRNR
ncbi:hypothetical protein EJ05DRAFT_486741 [Pseudovirgaria hyperparasitica]|uniref:SRR1-like domain-containing protein n=1 Tax=Pseudovirgaria hyperparasitica TaxID=470096 RepID=A0A6A6W593_9PEZI|nr:uncharacterized protein EJ05DRAFT_486741 [Pseudovirgaria hyperparasitica]KAF2757715.1 hypothetical protein EJ05DRAFT_486741 [Pseudovirgaria hyperparasitica]